MKGFNIQKILRQVKEIEKENKKVDNMINNLLPATLTELQQVITLNNLLDTDY